MTTEPTNAELAETFDRIADVIEHEEGAPGIAWDAAILHTADLRIAATRLRSDPPVDEQGVGASSGDDRASRATPQAAARLDQKATIPCAELLELADKAVEWALDSFGGYCCPEVDAGIHYMQARGKDRWSMQAQMENECFNCGGSKMERWLGRDNTEEVGLCPVCQPASAIETRQGGDREDGLSAQHESAARRGRPDDTTTVRARALEEAACIADKAIRTGRALQVADFNIACATIASAIRALAGKEPS